MKDIYSKIIINQFAIALTKLRCMLPDGLHSERMSH